MTFPDDGPASGKFTKTFMKRDYVVKFVNEFVNTMFLYLVLFVNVLMNEFVTFVDERPS